MQLHCEWWLPIYVLVLFQLCGINSCSVWTCRKCLNMTQLKESQPKQHLTIPILTALTSLNSEVVLPSLDLETVLSCIFLVVLYSIYWELAFMWLSWGADFVKLMLGEVSCHHLGRLLNLSYQIDFREHIRGIHS